MKKIFLGILLLLSTNIFAQNEKLTNQSIIDMIELGFDENVIITKVETSEGNFDTSINALKSLKDSGVSQNIIVSIMKANKKEININKASNDKIGIYIKKGDTFTKILPTVFSGSKTNTLASAFTYGIASAKMKSTMNNAHSNNLVSNNLPEFYFYFKKEQSNSFSVGQSNWWFASATSPNEFVLTELKVKGKKRELITGSVNAYSGVSFGIDEENTIKFNIEQIDEYSYKVVPDKPLESGEYCFCYQGTIPQGGFNNQSAFDFSVSKDYDIIPKYEIWETVWTLKNNKPYRFDIRNIDIRKDGVYYIGMSNTGKQFEYIETECYPTKKELLISVEKKREALDKLLK